MNCFSLWIFGKYFYIFKIRLGAPKAASRYGSDYSKIMRLLVDHRLHNPTSNQIRLIFIFTVCMKLNYIRLQYFLCGIASIDAAVKSFSS
jgi:hypothetical protein